MTSSLSDMRMVRPHGRTFSITQIPEKFGAPIRERFSESDTMRPPGVQMPVSAPGRKVNPNLAEPKE